MLTALVEQAIIADAEQSITFAVEDVPELVGCREDYLAAVFVYQAFTQTALRELWVEFNKGALGTNGALLETRLGKTPLTIGDIRGNLNVRYNLKTGELRKNYSKFLRKGLVYLEQVGLVKFALGDSGQVFYAKQEDERQNSKLKKAQIAAYKKYVASGLTLNEYKRQQFEALLAS